MEQKVEMGPFERFKVGSGTLWEAYKINLYYSSDKKQFEW